MPKRSTKTLKKIGIPTEKYALKFINPKYKDQKYFLVRFEGNFTKDQIIKFAQQKSNEIFKKTPQSEVFQIGIKTKSGEFRSGTQTRPGERVTIWSEHDSDGSIVIEDEDIAGFDLVFTVPKNR
jgi:hypothetical protein